MRVGETFHAEVNAIIDGTSVENHMDGIGLRVGNEDGGWQLSVEWRAARNFFGDVPDDWGSATEEERGGYFTDYLIARNGLEPTHETEEVEISVYWLHGAGRVFQTPPSYTETPGKMVRFYRQGIHRASVVVGFYSLHLQDDDEGAFFIEFSNFAEDEATLNENQAILEGFLSSITLQRFYR